MPIGGSLLPAARGGAGRRSARRRSGRPARYAALLGAAPAPSRATRWLVPRSPGAPTLTGSRSPSLTIRRRPPRRRLRRAVAYLLATAVTLLVLWVGVLAVLWLYAWFQLGGDDVAALDEAEATALGLGGALAPPDATTLLLIVTDDRDPTLRTEPALAAPPVLLQLGGPRTDPAVLVLPSDLPVAVDGAGELTLAEVQRTGGLELMVTAVRDHTQVRIDHVVSVGRDVLPRLVEELGPVQVCGDDGCRSMVADDVRLALSTGEPVTRVRAVAAIVHAVAAELTPARAATDPLTTKRVVDILIAQVRTDVPLRGHALLGLAGALSEPVPLDVDEVPLLLNPETGGVVPLLEPTQIRFQHLQQGTPFTGGDVQEAEEALLAGVEVAVLNGAGVDGLAGRVRLELEAAGFTVVGTGNAPSFDHEVTSISYAAGDPAVELAAARLREVLPGARLDELAAVPAFEGDEVDVLVIAGHDR